jgi:hypothetical protein
MTRFRTLFRHRCTVKKYGGLWTAFCRRCGQVACDPRHAFVVHAGARHAYLRRASDQVKVSVRVDEQQLQNTIDEKVREGIAAWRAISHQSIL